MWWSLTLCRGYNRHILGDVDRMIVYIMVVSFDGGPMSSFIFLHELTLSRKPYIKYREEVALLWIKRASAGRPYVALAGEVRIGYEKISATASLPTTGRLTPPY